MDNRTFWSHLNICHILFGIWLYTCLWGIIRQWLFKYSRPLRATEQGYYPLLCRHRSLHILLAPHLAPVYKGLLRKAVQLECLILTVYLFHPLLVLVCDFAADQVGDAVEWVLVTQHIRGVLD